MEHYYNGTLHVDTDKGIAIFTHDKGRLLRVTHLPVPIPEDVSIDVVAISNITSYTLLTSAEVADWTDPAEEARRSGHPERQKSGLKEWAERQIEDDYVKIDTICPVCTKVHESSDFTKWGPYTFITGHEYIIWTRNSQQTYAHRGRMQYLGHNRNQFKYQLTFNARGPDRSTEGKYAGTQQLDARNIVKLEEVDRDASKRYVDEIDRDMPRTKAGN